MKNLEIFLREQQIEFSSEQKKLSWVKRLRPKTLVRVGSSYFIDEKGLNGLLKDYFVRQIALRKKRAAQARKNFSKVKVKDQVSSNLFTDK